MGKDPQSQPTENKAAGGKYFITGSILLFLMAFVWSIDGSFVYILLGAATFFFFLGFRDYFAARPIRQSFSQRVHQTYRTTAPQEEQGSVLEDFSELLKQAQQRAQAASAQPGSTNAAAGKKIVMIAVFFIGAIFFVIILSVGIMSRSSESDMGQEINTDYNEGPPETNLGKGYYFYGNQQWDSAYFYYKRALKENPNDTTAMEGYGSSLYMLNYPDSALIMYDKALSINPGFDLARLNKAWVYKERKNYSQALMEVQTLLRGSPEYADAYALQGEILYNQGEYQQALKSYEEAYQRGMINGPVCVMLGELYSRQGDNQKAIAFYQEALTYDSTDIYVYKRLGEIIPGDEGSYYRQRAQQSQQ